jgi:arylsulfatase A-like enzyme
MYEESLHMPFIVKWPGVTNSNSSNAELVQNLDFAPTFLDIAGIDIPPEMQGESLVPLLSGQEPQNWRKSIYYHYYEYPGPHMVQKHYGVRTERYKLINYYELDEWELFDLENDQLEVNNVFGKPGYENIQEDMKIELNRLIQYYEDFTVPKQ